MILYNKKRYKQIVIVLLGRKGSTLNTITILFGGVLSVCKQAKYYVDKLVS